MASTARSTQTADDAQQRNRERCSTKESPAFNTEILLCFLWGGKYHQTPHERGHSGTCHPAMLRGPNVTPTRTCSAVSSRHAPERFHPHEPISQGATKRIALITRHDTLHQHQLLAGPQAASKPPAVENVQHRTQTNQPTNTAPSPDGGTGRTPSPDSLGSRLISRVGRVIGRG